MSKPIIRSHDEIYLGALMSDLVAGIHALVTEAETGKSLEHRVKECKTTMKVIADCLDRITEERQ